jgi:hypothetical protein
VKVAGVRAAGPGAGDRRGVRRGMFFDMRGWLRVAGCRLKGGRPAGSFATLFQGGGRRLVLRGGLPPRSGRVAEQVKVLPDGHSFRSGPE